MMLCTYMSLYSFMKYIMEQQCSCTVVLSDLSLLVLQDVTTEPAAKKANLKAAPTKNVGSSKPKPGDKKKQLTAADESWRAKLLQKVVAAKTTPAAAQCHAAEQRYRAKCASLGVAPSASIEVSISPNSDDNRIPMRLKLAREASPVYIT
jgi:hypothetical protein